MATTKPRQSVFAVIIFILFILLPVFKATNVVDHTLVPRQLLVSVGTGVLLLAMLASGLKAKLNIGLVAFIFLGFLLMNFISVSAAINPVESWATISRYLLAFAFLVSLQYLLQNGLLKASQLIKTLVVFGGIAAIITLFQLMKALGSGEFFSDIYSVTGNFSHKNLLSSALMLAFPFAIMGAATLEGAWKKGSLVLVFLLVMEMFVLRTRGVWLAVFVGAISTFLIFLWINRKSKLKLQFPYKLVGAGAGIALVLVIILFSARGVQESVTDTTNLDKRIVFWNNSLEMLKEHPVIGVGAGNWKINFPKYGLDGLDYNVVQGITHVQRPHNDYLWVLTEAGPLALLFFLGIFAFTFRQLVANLRKAASKQEVAIDFAIAFGLIAYMVFSITDFPLERSSHNILLMSLIALGFRNGINTSIVKMKASPVMIVLLGGVIFSLVVSAYRWQGEKHSVDVLAANSTRNPRQIIPAAEDAVNPFYNMDNFANPIYYYSSLGKLVLKRPDEALDDALMAYEIAPYNIITLTQLGNVYRSKGNLQEAMKYYDMATNISSRFEVGRFTKSELYLNQEEYVKAMRELWHVNPFTTDPRMKQQLPYAMQQLYRSREEHGQFPGLMRFMGQHKLQTPEDYMQMYYDFVNSDTNAQKAKGTKS